MGSGDFDSWTTASANLRLTVTYCSQSEVRNVGPHVGDVTQRPEPFVGEAVVVTGFLLRAEPDAAELIGRPLDGHGHPVVSIHDVAVGGAAAMRNPCPGTGAHDRFERRDHAARRPSHFDRVAVADVDVRLAIRHDDDRLSAKLGEQDRAHGLGRPGQPVVVARLMLGFDVADQRAEFAGNRPQFRRVGLPRGRTIPSPRSSARRP